MRTVFSSAEAKRRAAMTLGALIVLGAVFAANKHGWFHLIAPPSSLSAVERNIDRAFADVRHLAPAEFVGLARAPAAKILVVDVREEEEFAVSRIDGALRIDPGASAADVAAMIGDRAAGADIVFYCSVGRRSSVLARRAEDALVRSGARGVYNLKGGIFAWRNGDRPVFNEAGPTRFVHPYDEHWGRLLDDPAMAAYEPAAPE